jgi:hypothetical protein
MAGQGSARVTLREIDLSQVSNPQQTPQGIPAAVVGSSKKGPAFVPQTIANMQQFNEIFGSMSERGLNTNSNLMGPLALNEWMKNAQAGTFLRVLGVGNGLKSTGGKVTDAGFVVGNKLVQKTKANGNVSGFGKTADNPHANTAGSPAQAVTNARTHMLGCFMKDAANSSYLQDAGIQTIDVSSSVEIDLGAAPADNDYVIFQAFNATGESKYFKFLFATGNANITFNGGAGTIAEPQIATVGINVMNATAVIIQLNKALSGLNQDDVSAGATPDPADYFVSTIDADDATKLVIKQEGVGDNTNTNVVFNINNTAALTSGTAEKTNSTLSETVTSTTSGATAAQTTITVSNKPRVVQHTKSIITVAANAAPQEDELFTITDGAGSTQDFRFKPAAQGLAQTADNLVIDIGIDDTNNSGTPLTGQPLATAIHNAITAALTNNVVVSAIAIAELTSTDNGDLTVTLETVSNVNKTLVSNNNAAGITFVQTQDGDDTADSFTVTDIFGNACTFTFKGDADGIVRNAQNDYYIKIQTQVEKAYEANDRLVIAEVVYDAIAQAIANFGADAANDSITELTLVDPDGTADNFTITSGLKGALANIVNLVRDVNSSITDTQTDGTNGTPSSITLTLNGLPNVDDEFTLDTYDPSDNSSISKTYKFVNNDNGASNGVNAGGKYQIELSSNIDFILSNIQDAIETVEGAFYIVELDGEANTAKITNQKTEGFVQDKDFVFSMSENVSVSGATTKSGNFGPKTLILQGGGGSANPIIRGVLMSPQGILPSLMPNSALNAAFNVARGTFDVNVRAEVNAKTFGSNQDSNSVVGYVVGDVDSTTQGMTLLLNGFKNSEKPAVINCSFDPDSSSYFAKVLNTDPTKIEEYGHYLYSHWDIDSNVAIPSNAGLNHGTGQLASDRADMIGFCVSGAASKEAAVAGKPDYETFSHRFGTAKTPWIVSQFFGKSGDTSRHATAEAGSANKLFRLHCLDSGSIGNELFRLMISNVQYNGQGKFGSFDMSLEAYDSDPISGTPIVTWKNLNLDTSSRNFVGRVIGDEHIYYDFDSELAKQRLVVDSKGQFSKKNNYVRVEVHDNVMNGIIDPTALPVGFQGHSYLNTKINGNFIEPTAMGANRVFTDSSNNATETLSQAQVLPLDFVTSTSRTVSTSKEADNSLAWGVKLAVRENNEEQFSELSEQVFNNSLMSWSKFFPTPDIDPAWITNNDTADSFQNSMFSLEKIQIPAAGIVSDSITSWDGSVYRRDGSQDSTITGRFVNIEKDATGANSKHLKFRCLFQGGFDGVNIFDTEKANITSVAASREANDETADSKFTGPTIIAYQRAIDVLSDTSAAEFQLLALPGQREPIVTDYAIKSCEDRFDALLIMDILEKDSNISPLEESSQKPHVRNTISAISDRLLNTSFAASYFPDVVIKRPSDSSPIIVAPSVGMLGVMSRNDSIADPWFAPAGLERGRLQSSDVRVQMNRDLLDEMYDADINPIYVPAGRQGEVYAFGQKTMFQEDSALDRINVRRLLIDIRRKVKKVGEQLLFEPNRESTLAKFAALVEPIMQRVQARRGVTRYKVQIDSTTTTQNDVETNTIRGKIYLQPAKSVEFISLDFVVANTIQD